MNTRNLLFLAFLLAAAAMRVESAVCTFQTAGYWSVAANWANATKPGNGDTVVIAANCTVDENISILTFGAFIVNSNINLYLGQYALVFTGTVTNNGLIHTECTSPTPLPANKTWGNYVFFEATGAQTVPPGTYERLKLSATGSSRTVSAGGDITVTYELYVEGFTNANQAVFDLGTYRLLGSPTYCYVSGMLRTANTSQNPLPSGLRWYSNIPMRQGTMEFYATTPQYVPGGTYDDDVILTGSTKTLTGVMYSNGVLTLRNAVLAIVDSSVIVGTSGTISTAAGFSASNMIATTGIGFLYKRYGTSSTYTFPLGDLTGTAEYSPATLQFTNASATLMAGVRVVNAKHPQNTSSTSYINRYWVLDVTSTGLPSGNASFTYVDADVVGMEDSIYTQQYSGTLWLQRNRTNPTTNELTATAIPIAGHFTGFWNAPPPVCIVDARVLLQGPALGSMGTMSTALNTARLIPLSQPYNTAPWNYPGTESVTAIPSPNVVDWVLLELRSTPSGSPVARKAGFILYDGRITDVNGTSPVPFAGVAPGGYYIVVRHRNHLAVMSADTVSISTATPLYDFTTAASQAYGTEPMVGLANGQAPFALWAGDANADGQLKYTGTSNDPSFILLRIGSSDITATVTGYHKEDTGMDGVVQYSGPGNDRAVILRNIGGVNIGNTRSTQVP
ncbi:MAG: hypothetical protein QHI48_05605 [Bacteroidota bacterium]|nr:hypothetical protein [Bacteroidota bacterium]